jgi:hypothetical protein
MATDSNDDGGAPYEYSPRQLREMDDAEARTTLTVAQHERREKLLELDAQAEETQQKWADEDQQVADVVVHADPESLGTAVEIYGNDLLVHIDEDDAQLRAAVEDLRDLRDRYSDLSPDEYDEIDERDQERMVALLQDLLDAVLVRWNDAEWADLEAPQRRAILDEAADKWGVNALFNAWVDVQIAIYEDREERLDVIESFRESTGRGRR